MSEITPTKTIFRLQAGPIEFNATFLAPIEPTDYVRQSIPFSYMFIDGFSANDFKSHDIQVYTDITAQWATSEDTQVVVWKTTETDTIIYHNATRQSPLPMTENNGLAEDSIVYYAMSKRSGIAWQIGEEVAVRAGFNERGSLTNSADVPQARTVGPTTTFQNWLVFAFSVDLGTIAPGNQPDPVVVALGIVRDPSIANATEPSVQNRRSYYWSAYSGMEEVVSAFLSDSSDARNRNSALDSKIVSAALAVSPEYADIVSLVTRQIFAAMDITIPPAQSEQSNNSDVKIFMKDMGMSLRVNPVETIYGAFPALLYLNPSLAKDLLVPLLDFQMSSSYNNSYAAPDLGTRYPTVFGNNSDTRPLAVENCGNMLIMVYAYAVKSGDGTLLSRYYNVLRGWADFLVGNSLHPRDFITADGLNNGDMSNLALKGILGIYSMAKINEAVRIFNNTYMDCAVQFIAAWKQSAVTDSHIEAVYGQPSSWGLMYNLFSSIWLNTGLVENSTLFLQAQFYAQQTNQSFGFDLDSSQPDVAYPHWALLTAATIPDSLSTVRDQFINPVHQQAYRMTTNFTLPNKYDPSTGNQLSGSGSAIQGAAFGMLALSLPNVDIKADGVQISSGPRKNVNGIIGGIIGGLAFVLILGGGYFLWYKWKRKQGKYPEQARPFITAAPSPTFTLDYHSNDTATRKLMKPSDNGTAATTPPFAVMPGKQQGVLGQRPGQNRKSMPDNLPSSVPTPSDQGSTPVSGTEELRAEMEQLRRELDSIRHITEAPPGYI
ncbi:hypothetical protein P691DRAFT_407186 [Macrolepiota fuliginosa MF-IS2]|uniref:DUF1793-domain-containing protein n=1 Tax=Macrolepiota fuliginosa MF-IS2 TaxID=1400762 RepID=A0A9P5X2C6_9AGAR|nr:hypothetical protein P691DRAFT_407186 [Macrolepiota fuliginosa MF-IS2]